MLKADGKEIKYVFEPGDPETFPVVADLDQDGRLDLIQGVASGYVWFYKNIGTATEPSWRRAYGCEPTTRASKTVLSKSATTSPATRPPTSRPIRATDPTPSRPISTATAIST